jgi:hypothetical protein
MDEIRLNVIEFHKPCNMKWNWFVWEHKWLLWTLILWEKIKVKDCHHVKWWLGGQGLEMWQKSLWVQTSFWAFINKIKMSLGIWWLAWHQLIICQQCQLEKKTHTHIFYFQCES